MVGTNRSDYDAGAGLSRTFAGNGSDGLVRVANASVWGVNEQGMFSAPSATAYCYRSHSGRFGIVNSEEAYQNLVRFLFGDMRVDLWVDIEDVRVPQELEPHDRRESRRAVSVRDARLAAWQTLVPDPAHRGRGFGRVPSQGPRVPRKRTARRIYLSTVFLANRYKANHEVHDALIQPDAARCACRTTR